MARDGVGFTGRIAGPAALGVVPVRVPGWEEDGEEGAAAAPSVPLPPRKDRPAMLRKLAGAGWLTTGRGPLDGGDGGRAGRAERRSDGGEGDWGGGGGGRASGGGGGGASAPWYGIGPRSFAELMSLLIGETDAPEERKAAWGEL